MFMYYAWSRYVLSTFRNHGLHSQGGTASCDNGTALLCFMPAVLFSIFLDNIVLRVTCQLIFIHQNASPHAGHTSKWYKWDQISDKLADEKPTKKGFSTMKVQSSPPFPWFNQRWTLLVDVIHIVLGVIRHLPRLGGQAKPSLKLTVRPWK